MMRCDCVGRIIDQDYVEVGMCLTVIGGQYGSDIAGGEVDSIGECQSIVGDVAHG